ncbi:hypothetical protein P8864_03190 [Priestia flexa]|nr:hypothetical protein [Priestia flexa]MEC0664971.1 hypothetical protein [Priestia flexa]
MKRKRQLLREREKELGTRSGILPRGKQVSGAQCNKLVSRE